MLRQLLTLLAVISGLTLVAEPTRALEADAVSLTQSIEQGDCDTVIMRPLELAGPQKPRELTSKPCAQGPAPIYVPTVQLQADRARE